MTKRMLVALNLVLATALAWVLLGLPAAGGATTQSLMISAPTFVGLAKSTHNDGNPKPADACSAQQPLTQGDEHFGDLNAAKGSFLAAVNLPKGAAVTSFSLFANDFDTDEDVHAYLVRKGIVSGTTPKERGYVAMANANSNGAVDTTIRKFTDTTINGPTITTSFEYFAEIVVCGNTEPFAVQIVYTT